MPGFQDMNNFEEYDEIENNFRIRNVKDQRRDIVRSKPPRKKTPDLPADIAIQMAEQADDLASLELTYNASRHERVWIVDALKDFFDQRWLEDVLRLVKGGKEANVYQCTAHSSVQGLAEPYLAAKIYRPRRFRNLKNDHLYRESRADLDENGNLITDGGKLHAIAKRTEFGRELSHTSWIEYEVKTIQRLHAAGADVPRVFASEHNAILMSFIGDSERAAPILHGIRLGAPEARQLFDRVIHNIELMLAFDCIHGDLSAFNILYMDGEITLIDFPQAIDPHINRNAYWIFQRDVTRICEYFSRQGVKSNPGMLAAGMWKAHHLKVVPDVHPGLLDSEDEADRSYWNRLITEEGR